MKISYTSEVAKGLYKAHPLKYETFGSAGIDVRAVSVLYQGNNINLSENHFILPKQEKCLVKTGFCVALLKGFEMQVRSRSGLALKNGIFVLNSPGTVDSDYRGEVGVILYNTDNDFKIELGDRIAQVVIAKYETVEIEILEELDDTARKTGGFGSTGVK